MTPRRHPPRRQRLTIERTVITRQAAVVYVTPPCTDVPTPRTDDTNPFTAAEIARISNCGDIEWTTLSVDVGHPALTGARGGE
ncbi:hypothetical protein P7L78_19205 [Tistrella bauzanensis]|uniref:hypothetical protein n=1 Tax=Tistrella TaxID=171436 RepID=UPI0031F6EF6E